MGNHLVQIFLVFLQLNIALAQSHFARHSHSDFIGNILKAHNDDRQLVNSPPLEWDQELANCAFVAACFQKTGFPGEKNSHSFQIGLRECNSYTCLGVTCKYRKGTENVAGFHETPDGNGYIDSGGVGLWLAEVGGHHGAVQNPENTKIGCATFGDSELGILYCRYSDGCTCKDDSCCDSCYPVMRNGQCKDTVKSGLEYYSPGLTECEGFPDATSSITGGLSISNKQERVTPVPRISNLPVPNPGSIATLRSNNQAMPRAQNRTSTNRVKNPRGRVNLVPQRSNLPVPNPGSITNLGSNNQALPRAQIRTSTNRVKNPRGRVNLAPQRSNLPVPNPGSITNLRSNNQALPRAQIRTSTNRVKNPEPRRKLIRS